MNRLLVSLPMSVQPSTVHTKQCLGAPVTALDLVSEAPSGYGWLLVFLRLCIKTEWLSRCSTLIKIP